MEKGAALYEQFMNSPLAGHLGLLNVEDQAELLGFVAKAAIAKPTIATNLVKKVNTAAQAAAMDKNPRGEALRRLDALPKEIREGLLNGRLQIIDSVLYSKRSGSALTALKMFQSGDSKVDHTRNLTSAKLDEDRWFLHTGTAVQSGVNATLLATDFGIAADDVRQGSFLLEVNGKKVYDERTPLTMFNTEGRTDVMQGYAPNNNPKWFEPGKEIKFDTEYPVALATNTNVFVQLFGAMIIPY